MQSYAKFKGYSDIGRDTFGLLLQANLKNFIDWGLLNIGGFINVNIAASGAYSNALDTLRPTQDPQFSNGRVWVGQVKNWVWESGLETSIQPTRISGIVVNGTFYPSNTVGTYAHYVDYPNGRVVFNSPISINSTVKISYSYKSVHVVDADSRFFQTIRSDTYKLNQQPTSGSWTTQSKNQIQLPCIAIELVPNPRSRPLQLGGGQISNRDVICHILTDNPNERLMLMDILADQKEKGLYLYDTNKIALANRFPLTVYGSIAPSALTYNQLLESGLGFRYCTTFIEETSQEVSQNLPNGLFYGAIRLTMEAERNDI